MYSNIRILARLVLLDPFNITDTNLINIYSA